MAGLDRRVTLTLHEPGEIPIVGDGTYTPGPVLAMLDVWANVIDGGQVDVLAGGTLRVVSRAVFTVRFDQRIADTAIRDMALTYNDAAWNVETVTNYADRRRFIQLAAVAGS